MHGVIRCDGTCCVLQEPNKVAIESACMGDLQHLLRLAKGAQVITDEDIRTLSDVKSRLGVLPARRLSADQVIYWHAIVCA